MMVKWISILSMSIMCFSQCFGQFENYDYMQPIEGVENDWHKVQLPDGAYAAVKQDLSDIRIIGITQSGDTVVAPYLLENTEDNISNKQVPYRRINNSKTADGYYTTFSLDENMAIDNIELDFKTRNFDWKVQLEGSMDQKEWFTILSDYRILGIKSVVADYQYSRLSFSASNYKYYRLFVPSDFDPGLNTAIISKETLVLGEYNNYKIENKNVKLSSKDNTTEVDIELSKSVPVSRLNINIKDKFDYYRPMKVQYLRDSFETDKGWKYSYATLTNVTLSSLDKGNIDFKSTITNRLKVTIQNGDNQPLEIADVAVSGSNYELVARFAKPADYYLLYGNESARKPNYDIKKFEKNIPKDIKTVKLGAPKFIKTTPTETSPLIQNKLWLWLVMGLAIVVMGWFTLSMMRGKE